MSVFSDPENLHQVLLTVIEGAVTLADPQSQKMCFVVLRKLVEVWAGDGGLAGFTDFLYKHILPACFMAPMKPSFDLSDAQTVLVCIKVVLDNFSRSLLFIYLLNMTIIIDDATIHSQY